MRLLLAVALLFPAFASAADNVRVTLRIASVCSSGPFAVPSWCPDPGPGVSGGFNREIVVKSGTEVELRAENNFPWQNQDGVGLTSDVWLVIVPREAFERCHRPFASPAERESCVTSPAFDVSVRMPVGSTYRTSLLTRTPGVFYYYDALHASGYGILRVVP